MHYSNTVVGILLTVLGRAGDSMKVTQRRMCANYTNPQPPLWDSDWEEAKVIKTRCLNKGVVHNVNFTCINCQEEFRNMYEHKQSTFKSKHKDDLCTGLADPAEFWNKIKLSTKVTCYNG